MVKGFSLVTEGNTIHPLVYAELLQSDLGYISYEFGTFFDPLVERCNQPSGDQILANLLIRHDDIQSVLCFIQTGQSFSV